MSYHLARLGIYIVFPAMIFVDNTQLAIVCGILYIVLLRHCLTYFIYDVAARTLQARENALKRERRRRHQRGAFDQSESV